MSAISQALSLMKVKDDKYKAAAIKEYNELLRLAAIGKALEYCNKNDLSENCCGVESNDYVSVKRLLAHYRKGVSDV